MALKQKNTYVYVGDGKKHVDPLDVPVVIVTDESQRDYVDRIASQLTPVKRRKANIGLRRSSLKAG